MSDDLRAALSAVRERRVMRGERFLKAVAAARAAQKELREMSERECTGCDGAGTIVEEEPSGGPVWSGSSRRCTACDGRGRVFEEIVPADTIEDLEERTGDADG